MFHLRLEVKSFLAALTLITTSATSRTCLSQGRDTGNSRWTPSRLAQTPSAMAAAKPSPILALASLQGPLMK